MARGAVKRKKQVKPPPSRSSRSRSASSSTAGYPDNLFFPGLRRHAKWVFVFLAFTFAIGFVVFGVGSGTGSFGLGELFNSGGSSNGPSEKDAREKIKKNPKNAAAYKELATALQTKGDRDGAIAALVTYTTLKPNNAAGQTTLATLYANKASALQGQVQALQARQSELTAVDTYLQPSLVGPGTKKQPGAPVVPSPQLTSLISNKVSTKLSKAQTEQTAASKAAQTAYTKLTKLHPRDPQAQLQLAAFAQQSGDYKTALKAYQRFLTLAPDDPTAKIVRRQVNILKQVLKANLTPVKPSAQSG